MKHLFITFLIAIKLGEVIGQTQTNKDLEGTTYDINYFNQISTDWRNAYINKINEFNWTNPSTSIRTFSTFDNPVTIGGINYYAADNIELPFFRQSTPNVNNPNLLNYALNPFVASNLDIHPEDGWEMLQMDFGGKFVNLSQLAKANEINDYPHIILYNRYVSKLRIYFLVPHEHSFNGAFITATFPDKPNAYPNLILSKRTALFSHAKPITNVLMEFDNKCYLTATNEYTPNSRILQWIYGEFDLAYDPCTCLLKEGNHTSKISFQLYTNQLTKIDLNGESGTVQNITNPSISGAQNVAIGKTAFMDLQGAIGAGQQHYKDWEAYQNSATGILNTGYDLWSKKLEEDFFKYYSGGINDPKTGLPITDLTGLKTSGIWEEWLKIEKTSDPDLNLIKGLKNVASVIPYVGAAIGIVDYLSSGGKKEDKTVAAPSISQSKFTFTGNLNYTNSRDVNLNTPGAMNQSFYTIDAYNNDNGRLKEGTYLFNTENPMYNKTLGVFNLIGAPKFECINYQKFVQKVDLRERMETGNLADQTYKPIAWFDIQENRITEIPKYVVNPAADVEVISIDAAIILEFESNPDGYNLFMDKFSDWAKFYSLPFHLDYWKNPSNITLAKRVKSIKDAGLELEYVSNNYPTVAGSVIKFRTSYVPYNCLTIPNFTIFNWGKGLKVYLKLLVRMQRKHKGSSANFTTFSNENEKIPINMVFTYDVTNAYNSRTVNTWDTKGVLTMRQTPYNIHDFNGQPITPEAYSWLTIPNSSTLEDWRSYKITLNSTAYPNPFLPNANINYISNTAMVNTSGIVTIPNGAVIPPNAIIRGGDIFIGNNVTFGNNVEIIGGNQITLDESITEINPEVLLKIEPILWNTQDCKDNLITDLRANDVEIRAICSSTAYKNSSGLNKTNSLERYNENQVNTSNILMNITLYPNPTSSITKLQFTSVSKSIVSINIIDISGNQIMNLMRNNTLEQGIHSELINTQNFSSGIYFCTVSTSDGFTETKKIVVAH